ncbi:MAG: alpha-L-fucosidase [Planctomycetia bacterium]|nr:alpha-L-fucosidase [Planctomycetia bacterium]
MKRSLMMAGLLVMGALILSSVVMATENTGAAGTEYEVRAAQIATLLPERPRGPGAPVSDRTMWDAVRTTYAKDAAAIIAVAEKIVDQPIPEAPEDLYRDYYKTGNRSRYQSVCGSRNSRISQLVIAECLENRGRFLPAIEAALDDFLTYPSWVLPAHDRNADIYDGRKIYCDLESTTASWRLATVDYWLQDRLSPEIRTKIRTELQRRTFEPYRKSLAENDRDNWWIRTENNWNAVCHAGVVGAALAILEDPSDRAFFVAAAEEKSEIFLNGFTADGYCSEGIGYWNYGFGAFVDMAETLYLVTEGRLDWFTRWPKIRTVAMFGPKMEISHGICGAFADCAIHAKPDSRMVSTLNRRLNPGSVERAQVRTPSLPREPVPLGLYAFPEPVIAVSPENIASRTGTDPGNDVGTTAPQIGGPRDVFPDAGVYLFRPLAKGEQTSTQRTDHLAMIVKGGHNAEMHNHNDVGSYTITLGGKAILPDPGGEIYTARTFSAKRYESNALNSSGHPVPVIAGKLQKTGVHAKGVIVDSESAKDGSMERITIDLTSAYDVSTLKRAVREVGFFRESEDRRVPEGGVIVITDSALFSTPEMFGTAFLSYEKWEKLTEGDESEEFIFRIGEGDSAVRVVVTADGSEHGDPSLKFTVTTIDEDMMSRQKPIRFGFTTASATEKATITIRVEKWNAPDTRRVDTDWMAEAGCGVFMHFLPGTPEQFAMVDRFDVETLADQLEQIGTKYFVFTIYQNSGWLNAPNVEYDRVLGRKAGDRCAKRDLPMELAGALAKRGIRLMLYVTAQTPNRDPAAQRAYGLKEGAADQPIDVRFAEKWADVFREWSDRYGDKVSGWWVDGCYEWVNFNDEIGEIYSESLRHGNPHAIVAFNPGVLRNEWATSDYTAGEVNEPLAITIDGRFTVDVGHQRHFLTFLGNAWGRTECRYTSEQWIGWITKIRAQSGAVTLDAHSNMDPALGPIGTLRQEQLEQLKAISAGVKENSVP